MPESNAETAKITDPPSRNAGTQNQDHGHPDHHDHRNGHGYDHERGGRRYISVVATSHSHRITGPQAVRMYPDMPLWDSATSTQRRPRTSSIRRALTLRPASSITIGSAWSCGNRRTAQATSTDQG